MDNQTFNFTIRHVLFCRSNVARRARAVHERQICMELLQLHSKRCVTVQLLQRQQSYANALDQLETHAHRPLCLWMLKGVLAKAFGHLNRPACLLQPSQQICTASVMAATPPAGGAVPEVKEVSASGPPSSSNTRLQCTACVYVMCTLHHAGSSSFHHLSCTEPRQPRGPGVVICCCRSRLILSRNGSRERCLRSMPLSLEVSGTLSSVPLMVSGFVKLSK